jgi:DNA invertase Pin-like site-specific DNA recombinase
MTSKQTLRAAIYCRTSNGDNPVAKQEPESIQISFIEEQRMLCHAKCDEMGYEVVGVFTDLNFSGRTYPDGFEDENDEASDEYFDTYIRKPEKRVRPGLGKLLRQDGIDVIVTTDVYRLFRPAFMSTLAIHLWELLSERGIKIHSVTDGDFGSAPFEHRFVTHGMLKNAYQRMRNEIEKAKSAGVLATQQGTIF